MPRKILPEKVYVIEDSSGEIVSPKYWTKPGSITSHLEYAPGQFWMTHRGGNPYEGCEVVEYEVVLKPVDRWSVERHWDRKAKNAEDRCAAETQSKIRKMEREIARLKNG